MKRCNIIFFVAIILTAIAGCSSDDDPSPAIGCLTGIPKNQTDRVLIRCSTKEQFLAGSNTNAGGTAQWDLYTNHKWEPCDDCK